MWDPYSGAYAYPRTQPRARYSRPRPPVYEQRGSPENHFPSKVEEPSSRKTVRTIPVTDGNVPVVVSEKVSQPEVAQKVQIAPVVVKFESEDAAATKIQAVYRGYSVRKTEPLKHLRVIMKIKEEFQDFKRKLQEKEQRKKLCSDSRERLRWTEGIMALLLRLDQLQGVHPEVRLIRKALAKELIVFQEKLDSMSDVSEEESVKDDAVAEEKSEICDAAEEGTELTDGDMNIPAAEAVEEMEVEESMPEGLNNVEDADLEETTQAEVHDTIATPERQEAMEQDYAPAGESNECEIDSDGIKVAEILISEEDVPHQHLDKCEGAVTSAATNCQDQGGSLSDPIGESMFKEVECTLEPGFIQASAEVPMDVENEAHTLTMVPAPDPEEDVEVEADSSQIVPPMDVGSDNQESSPVENSVVTATSTDFLGEPMSMEDAVADSTEKNDFMEKQDQSHDVGREEAGRLTNEVERPELDMSRHGGDDPGACTRLEERETDAGSAELGDRWMIPAPSTSLESQCAKSLQVGQPQISTADDTNSLSDRALLQQLLEENRKLKDVVGKVLHWGKQQNDIIHNLASRIEQLEEHQPQSNMLHGGKNNGRKRISNDVDLVGDRERSLRRVEKGRRKGKSDNRPQLGYLDSEWLSAESDEYF